MKPKALNRPRERLIHLERVFRIYLLIRSNRDSTTTSIAEHFEITTETAQRTLDFTRRLALGVRFMATFRTASEIFPGSESHVGGDSIRRARVWLDEREEIISRGRSGETFVGNE